MLYIMHRTQIYIDDDEWKALKELSSKGKKTVSDLIRSAIAAVYFSERKLDFECALDDMSGLWSDRSIDSEQFIRNLRTGDRKNVNEYNS